MPPRPPLSPLRHKRLAALLATLCVLGTASATAQRMGGQVSGGTMGSGQRGPGYSPPQQQQGTIPLPPPPPPSTVDHLHGIVFSSLDGKPVARVLVTSLGNQGLAVLSDYQGRFAFDLRRPLPPQNGTANLASNTTTLSFNLRRPGYVPRQLNIPVPAYTPSAPEPDLRLTITPAGAITGHVSVDTGHLPQFLNIQLRRKQVADGVSTFIPINNVQLDPNGDFRFGDLAPGDYKLSAMQTTELNRPGARRGPRASQDQPESVRGTRTTFYPDADTLATAAVLHVAPGELVTADLPLRSVTFYRVTIPVASPEQLADVNAMVQPEGLPGGLPFDPREQTLRGFMPTGTYTIRLNASVGGQRRGGGQGDAVAGIRASPNSPEQLTASVTVHVAGGPVQIDPVALHPSTPIPVLVRSDFVQTATSAQPPLSGVPAGYTMPQLVISLVSVDPGDGFGGGVTSTPDPTTGELVIRNAAEGRYRVRTVPFGSNVYVASLSSGGTDLLREPLVIGPNGSNAPIEVTLRNDPASLRITFDTGAPPGQPDPNSTAPPRFAIVTAIPLDSPERQAVVTPAVINTSPGSGNGFGGALIGSVAGVVGIGSVAGGFGLGPTSLNNLAPGRYLVFAREGQTYNMNQIAYRDPKAMEQLLPSGVTVTLTAGQKTDIRVPLLPSEDDQP